MRTVVARGVPQRTGRIALGCLERSSFQVVVGSPEKMWEGTPPWMAQCAWQCGNLSPNSCFMCDESQFLSSLARESSLEGVRNKWRSQDTFVGTIYSSQSRIAHTYRLKQKSCTSICMIYTVYHTQIQNSGVPKSKRVHMYVVYIHTYR